VEISYFILAEIQKYKNAKKVTIAEASKKIHIRASTEELPPLSVDDTDEYNFRASKTVRKGFLQSKQGTIIIESAQPSSLPLPPLDSTPASTPSTHLRLCLRFDPACENVLPPKLVNVSSKLRVNTFWSTVARKEAARKVKHPWSNITSDSITETLNMSCLSTSGVEWVQRRARDSTFTLGEEFPAPSEAYKDSKFFTAYILVPLSLPSCHAASLPPTFHSCLVSRTYSIQVSLSLSSTRMPISLNIPVQISAPPSSSLVDREQQEALAAVAAMEADEQFEPEIRGPGWMRSDTMGSMVSMSSPPAYEHTFTSGFARANTNGSIMT
jgi:hypothetical protein